MTWMTPNHHKTLSEPAMSSVFRSADLRAAVGAGPTFYISANDPRWNLPPEVARTLCTSTSPAPNFLGSLQNPSLHLEALHGRRLRSAPPFLGRPAGEYQSIPKIIRDLATKCPGSQNQGPATAVVCEIGIG